MFPLIRFVAVFGGVAAGAQVASGCVRAVKEVCHGRPVSALVEVGEGLAAPVLTAVSELSKCAHEVFLAVTEPWKEKPNEEPQEQASARPEKPSGKHEHAEDGGSLNGVATVGAKG